MPLKIIYQDESLLIVDKPPGIVCFPEEQSLGEQSIIGDLVSAFPDLTSVGIAPRYGVIHRLDKDTSGLLMIAKSTSALQYFQEALQAREIEKKYLTLLVGKVKQNTGTIDALIGRSPNNRTKQACFLPLGPDGGKKGLRPALTEYRKLKDLNGFTLVEALPKTGRKHQLRVHFSFIGHPLAGDKIYGHKNQPVPEGLSRQFLHAYYLKIKFPSGETREFSCPLPEDLQKVVDILELKSQENHDFKS